MGEAASWELPVPEGMEMEESVEVVVLVEVGEAVASVEQRPMALALGVQVLAAVELARQHPQVLQVFDPMQVVPVQSVPIAWS